MYKKSLKDIQARKQSLEITERAVHCKVSQASKEIMLDRFSKGKGIEFPFD